MADDRLSPKDIELLIASGDLTQDDLALLYQTGDRRGWATAMKLMEQAGKGPDMKAAPLMPPMAVKGMTTIADFIGAATGLPLGGGRKAPGRGSSSPASPHVPSGSQNGPGRASGGSRTTPNLERHGNVTRPGPDAHKGGGGPSRPSGPVDNPLDQAEKLKGPTGNPDNYRDAITKRGVPDRRRNTDPRRDSPLYRQMKDGLPEPTAMKEYRSGIDRRSPNVEKSRFNRLDPEKFDETDSRRTMFGGVTDQKPDNYKDPKSRGPLSKEEIEQMIKNLLSLRDQ